LAGREQAKVVKHEERQCKIPKVIVMAEDENGGEEMAQPEE
jgi:hypothetical protein